MRTKLIFAICSILLTFILLEAATRLSGVEISAAAKRMHLDPLMGWRWTPNYQNDEVYQGHLYHIKINELGLRNEKIVIPKPNGKQRIIALGDSITAGFGVNLEDTFVKRLQQNLNIEVINAGVDDYGIDQEVCWLENYGLELEPDMIIIGLYLNDSRSFTPPSLLVANLNNLFINRSIFYTYYYQQISELRVQQAEQSEEFRFRYGTSLKEEDWRTDPKAFAQIIEQANQDFGLGWDRVENEKIQQTLKRLIRLSQEHNFGILMVILPVSIQVLTEIESPLVDQPQRWIIEFAEANDVAYLDLLPILKAHITEDIYIDQAHLTAYGHNIVAEAIQEKLASHIEANCLFRVFFRLTTASTRLAIAAIFNLVLPAKLS